MGRRYRLSEKTKRFFLITLLLTPACYQIMPEIRMALVLAAMGEAVLSADRIWARMKGFLLQIYMMTGILCMYEK